MKVLSKKSIIEKNEVGHTVTEINILRKLRHPFVVNLRYAFQSPTRLFLVMDYVNGGELYYHLHKEKKFTEDRAKFYSAELLLAIEYLHSLGIVYRDLKLENILLASDGHIVLTDFGLAKEGFRHRLHDKTATRVGTPNFVAPEVYKGMPYGKAVDWWSFGIVIYEMVTGSLPFSAGSMLEIMYRVIDDILEFPQGVVVSNDATNLIRGLLNKSPQSRLQNHTVIKIAPFYRDIDFNKLARKEIAPPFIPTVVGGDGDVTNVHPLYLQEKVSIEDAIEEGELDPSVLEANLFGSYFFDQNFLMSEPDK
jgi:serine/threonine protein kinase